MSYPNQALSGLSIDNPLVNTAVSGSSSGNVLSRVASDVAILNGWGTQYKGKIYSLMIGVNDDYTTPSVTYSNIQSICASMVAAGARVVVLTILPANRAGEEAFRQTVNSAIRAGGSCPYTVADVGNDATIGQPGQDLNTAYYMSDGVHLIDAGYAIVGANYLRPALQSLGVQ